MPAKFSHVLTVDDDPIVHAVLQAFLAKHGIDNVIAASDGAAAISAIKSHGDIDLIISDLNMPEVDGVEFFTQLQAMNCKVPVIILSSAHKSIIAGASALAGVFELNLLGTLSKPVKFNELAALLGLRGNDATHGDLKNSA